MSSSISDKPGMSCQSLDSDAESLNLESNSSSSEYQCSSIDEDEYSNNADEVEGADRSTRLWHKIEVADGMKSISSLSTRFPFKEKPGLTVTMNADAKALEYFELFFDDTLFHSIVRQTNLYAEQYIKKCTAKKMSRFNKWRPTSVKELRLLFAVMMLQSIIKMPYQHLSWSKKKILNVPTFSEIMSSARYVLLMKFLNFSINKQLNKEDHPKHSEIMPHLKERYSTLYIPNQTLSFRESLMFSKRYIRWNMYDAKNKTLFGLKLFVLREAESGYIYDFLLYTGKEMIYNKKYNSLPVTTKCVLHLMDGLLGKGYCVTVDNRYMSPDLLDLLIKQRTDAYGTVSIKRKDLPEEFRNNVLEEGTIQAFQCGKIMALKWQNKTPVCFMSTFHDATARVMKTRSGKDVLKPTVALDYISIMGEVDSCNQEVSYYPIKHNKQNKFYKKILISFIDQALWNSSILYNKNSGSNVDFLDFKLQIIKQSIENYVDSSSKSTWGPRPYSTPSPLRLIGRHFPSYIPPNPIKKFPSRLCAICYAKKDPSKRIRKETRIWCKDCQVGLCLEPCFKIYHTQKNL